MCGFPCVLAAASYMRASLYGVQPNDPVIWMSAVVLLIGVAVMASLVPAWSAARIDPHVALRSE
jgi:ABC-type antimicrobial peptide transport system permease subunit